MTVTVKDERTVISLDGRIDTTNAQQVEDELLGILEAHSSEDISFDASKLEYISSAGLRVLLKIQKTRKLPTTLFNVSRDVYEIFETTGFTELLDVKKALRKVSLEGCDVIGKGDEKENDERGHLLGHQFGGGDNLENMVPMAKELNHGDYLKMESELADAVGTCADVRLKVEPVYDGNSHRPTEIRVTYSIDGDRSVKVFRNGENG